MELPGGGPTYALDDAAEAFAVADAGKSGKGLFAVS